MSANINQRTDLASVSVTLQHTTASLSLLGSQLSSVTSSLQGIRYDLDQSNNAIVATREAMEIPPGQQHQMQNRALTTEQMIAELHRCLVLGESLATAQSSLQNATSNERECVVSHSYWSPSDNSLLTLDDTARHFGDSAHPVPSRSEIRPRQPCRVQRFRILCPAILAKQ